MAVLVTANVENQTEEGWDKIFGMLGPAIRQAKGFIAVGGGHTREGWRAFEIWESAEEATDFFAKYVQSQSAADGQAAPIDGGAAHLAREVK